MSRFRDILLVAALLCGLQKLGAFEGRPIADCRLMMKSRSKQVTHGMETKQQV